MDMIFADTALDSRPMSSIDIITGDALDELPKIEEASVDLVIADPPYNLVNDKRSV